MNISVIIPVYNREKLVKGAIDSVMNQTKSPQEIIVVNDGSTDRTQDVLLEYQNDIRVIEQSNQGVSAARNAAIRSAKHEWLAFLDSDDEWHKDKLLKTEKFHIKYPQFKIFQSEEIWIRDGKRVNPKIKHKKYEGWIYQHCLPLCIVSPSAVVIHQDVFDDVGLFDEHFEVCEDYDLWLRIARKYLIGLDDYQGLIKYGGHDDQLSRKYWGMDHYRVMALEKQLDDPTLSSEHRRWTLETVISKLEILISGYKNRNKQSIELENNLNRYIDELLHL